MALTDVFGVFFTALIVILSSASVVFLGRPVQRPLLSAAVVSFSFRTFHIVVLAMPNVCLMALIVFPSFLSLKIACFSSRDSSLVFMLVYCL